MNISEEARKRLFKVLEDDGTFTSTPLERKELELVLTTNKVIETTENTGELEKLSERDIILNSYD